VIKARWEQLRQWMRGWKPVSTREYEALAREFALITGRCLQAEEALVKSRGFDGEPGARRSNATRRQCAARTMPGLTPGEMERLAVLSKNAARWCARSARSCAMAGRALRPTRPAAANRMALEREMGSVRAIVNLMLDNRRRAPGASCRAGRSRRRRR
jgi:Tfp pilus assembly protein PilV